VIYLGYIRKMRSDREIKRIANENITNLTDEEHDRFLVLEEIRREKMSKLVKKADGGMIKGFSPIARPQRFKGVF
tara:strand:+ start:1658 stop:1882 length:225 start_codon:yes stop_codon:yes gene_type:complete